MAQRLLPKLAIAGTAAGTTLFACHHLEGRRTPLDEHSCTASTIPAALTSLRTSGVAVVSNLRLAPETLRDVKSMPAAESMPTQLLKPKRQARRRGPPGANMMPADETWRLSAYGRYHRLENHLGRADVDVLERIERQIWPLVEEFFREEEKFGGGDGEGEASSAGIVDGIYRSELQLMTAVPGSGNQSWHKDNRARGLSIIVPLVDFRPDNGGTQLLLGSHEERWPLDRGGARVLDVPAGTVVAYDSRTIHRGLGNDTSEGRPALIFCYDRVESPPPGCGTLGSVATSYQGRMLDIVSGARNVLIPR